MTKIIWNWCDYHAGFNDRTFKALAYINHLLGCDYWYNSADYKYQKWVL